MNVFKCASVLFALAFFLVAPHIHAVGVMEGTTTTNTSTRRGDGTLMSISTQGGQTNIHTFSAGGGEETVTIRRGGSARNVERFERALPPFTRIESAIGIEVHFFTATTHRAVITTHADVEPHLVFTVTDETLYIDLRAGTHQISTLRADIYAPTLTGFISHTGETLVIADTLVTPSFSARFGGLGGIHGAIESENITLTLYGSGQTTVHAESDAFTATLYGGGTMTVTGTTAHLGVNINGGGIFLGNDFRADTAGVSIMSRGNAEVWVTDQLRASAFSGGSIRYRGDPEVIASGSGRVQQR